MLKQLSNESNNEHLIEKIYCETVSRFCCYAPLNERIKDYDMCKYNTSTGTPFFAGACGEVRERGEGLASFAASQSLGYGLCLHSSALTSSRCVLNPYKSYRRICAQTNLLTEKIGTEKKVN